MTTTLQCHLEVLDAFLVHCQQHLQPEDWPALLERLTSAPVTPGSSPTVWTTHNYLECYWQRLSRSEQRAFLREKQRELKEEL